MVWSNGWQLMYLSQCRMHAYCIRWIFGSNLIWQINHFWVISGFYIGKYYCILHALGNRKENLVVFHNLVDLCNSPNHQHKFYEFSFYMVVKIIHSYVAYIHICNIVTHLHLKLETYISSTSFTKISTEISSITYTFTTLTPSPVTTN